MGYYVTTEIRHCCCSHNQCCEISDEISWIIIERQLGILYFIVKCCSPLKSSYKPNRTGIILSYMFASRRNWPSITMRVGLLSLGPAKLQPIVAKCDPTHCRERISFVNTASFVVSFTQFSPTCGRVPLHALLLWPGCQP